MKIAVAAEENSLTSMTDDRFGRAKGFLVYDSETKAIQWIDNQKNSQASQGAGQKVAQTIIDSTAEILVAYDVGPKAFDLLKKSGIICYRLKEKVMVKEAITFSMEEKLEKIN
ncbi:TPA: hypothetical protein DCW38_07750 [candidate division WOR-3 bacterium]|uniref:Dinitrogenase iron-molybdenum cofactor biosynthesis domain-containing protein n=1 Tax=candidate division WOR-3 bacterium TaxID=2052148 RepID=A0A350HBY8_UNCW3|nr:hypothetical protein [candidate division WOR-3 bacterium]